MKKLMVNSSTVFKQLNLNRIVGYCYCSIQPRTTDLNGDIFLVKKSHGETEIRETSMQLRLSFFTHCVFFRSVIQVTFV